MKLLVVEDDDVIREGVCDFLKENEYVVDGVVSAEDGLRLLQEQKYHLILIDVMLPGISGIEMLKKIRESSDIPIIILTALSDEQTQVKIFDEYADDYLSKPFSLIILKKRVEAQIRRFYGNSNFWSYGKAKVDFKKYTAMYDGEIVNITTKEFKLLEYLITNKNITVTRNQIIDSIWDYEQEPYERVIDVYIKNIRQKLKLDCIKTVKGIGYKLENL